MMRNDPARRGQRAVAALLLLAPSLLARCGADFSFSVGPPPGESTPLAATYDITATWPHLFLPDFPATGVSLDLTMEIDPNSADDPSGSIYGTLTIHDASAGGLSRAFDPKGPIPFTGRFDGTRIDVSFSAPVTVGATVLFPVLAGAVSTDGRRMEGEAGLSNLPDTGTWFGVKQRRYLIAATDFGLLGSVSIVTVRYNSRFTVDRDVELTSGDPVAAASGGGAFMVNRLYFDNVQVLDPARNFATAIQFSTGNGSNPHDALLARPGVLYVPRYEPPFDDILIADARTGSALGSIPLRSLASNATGTPRPDRLARANGLVFAALQNIDQTFSDYGPGLGVFIDPATDTIVRAIRLAGQNPLGPPAIHPVTGEIYLSDAGVFRGTLPRALTGGIEVVDPISLTTRGLLVDDDDLGGNVSGVAVASDSRGWAVVVTSAGSNSIVGFDPSTGTRGPTALTTSALIPEIRYDGDGYLLVAEHDVSNPGLRILEATSGVEIARIGLSLPPFSIAILTREISRR